MGGAIAPALGQKGVKAKEFCDAFNEKTKHLPKGVPVYTTIYVMKDKSFVIKFNSESTADRIKKCLNITKCSKTPGRELVAKLTMAQVQKIAEEKMEDTMTDSVENMCKMIIGTAKSMGIEVI